MHDRAARSTCWRLVCLLLLWLLSAHALAAASSPRTATPPTLPIGLCTVHSPVTLTFECQLAAFGGYLPHPRHGEQQAASIVAKPVRTAQDPAMLACSNSKAPPPPLNLTVEQSQQLLDTTNDLSFIVLVHRGACAFQDKLLQVVATSTASVHAMVLINSDDTLLPMGALTYERDALHGAIAVSVKRSDGERLLQLVRDQATADASAAVTLSLTSAEPQAQQALERIEYLLHTNSPLFALETFMDAIPAPLRDVDALVNALSTAASQAQNEQLPAKTCSADALLALNGSTDWIAFFYATARAFGSLPYEFASTASLHAAVAGVSLVWTSISLAQEQDRELGELWQVAAHRLTDAGYYAASAFCLEQLDSYTEQQQRSDKVDGGVTPAECQRAFLAFVQGEIVESVPLVQRCVTRDVRLNVSSPSLSVAYETLTRLVALDMASGDVECLRLAALGSELHEVDSEDHRSGSHSPCCQRRGDNDNSGHRRQQFVFRSHFARELFHALNVMGVFLDELGAFHESLAFFSHAAHLCPDDVSLELRGALAVPIVFDSTEAIIVFYEQLTATIAALTARPRIETEWPLRPEDATYLQYTITPPTMFIGYQGVDVLATQRALFDLRKTLFPSLQTSETASSTRPDAAQPPLQSALPRRRRIAFISTWFRNHSVGKLLLGVVQRLDRTKFDVRIYRGVHFLRDRDDITAAFERAVDHFVDLPTSQDAALALLRADAIDVVVYPELGMDAWTVLLSHHRIAPVQCVFWGHPITTGNPSIDYFVSSTYFVSDDGDRESRTRGDRSDVTYHNVRFSEQVVLFRGLCTFFTRPDVSRLNARFTRSMMHLPENRRLYVCPQTLMKLHPAFDRVLDGILKQDSLATVVLLASETQSVWKEQLRRRFRRSLGHDSARRVLFMSTLPYAEFMALLSFADVILDPFPFGGGVTTLDALALGIPIVTLPAAQTVPQLAAGFLRYMHVTATIVDSVDAFIAVALAVAADADGLRTALQRELLQRHGALYEDTASVSDWNAFLMDVAAPGA